MIYSVEGKDIKFMRRMIVKYTELIMLLLIYSLIPGNEVIFIFIKQIFIAITAMTILCIIQSDLKVNCHSYLRNKDKCSLIMSQ